MTSPKPGFYQNENRDLRGNAMVGAVVDVFDVGTTTPATIYSTIGRTPMTASPLPAAAGLNRPGIDVAANIAFFAEDEDGSGNPLEYDVRVTFSGTSFTYRARPAPAPGGGGTGAMAPLTLTAPAAANVPLTLKGAASQSGDLFRLRDSTDADLWRVNPAGHQLVGGSAMLGVTEGVVDAMLVVSQPDSAIQTQIWRGSPRGDGFAYTSRISDGAHFTTNGAIVSNGASALLPQPVRESQSPPVQYMFAAGCDLSPALDNACYVSDTINSINHLNCFVQGGGNHPYFQIAYDGTLKWGDGTITTGFTTMTREADGSFAFKPNGTEKIRMKASGELGVNTATPTNMLTVDAVSAQLRLRTVPNRYRGDFDVSASGLTFTSYDDTGAVFMPYIVQAAQTQWRVGFTEKMRLDGNGDLGLGTGSPQSGLHVVTRSQFWPAIRAQGAASQSDPIQIWQNSGASPLLSVTAAGLPKWDAAANQQTTVGGAGGASALPATPTKYLKVVDSAGTVLCIPAYAAA